MWKGLKGDILLIVQASILHAMLGGFNSYHSLTRYMWYISYLCSALHGPPAPMHNLNFSRTSGLRQKIHYLALCSNLLAIITLQKRLTTEWLYILAVGDSGYENQYINYKQPELKSYHTQLTTLRTSVGESIYNCISCFCGDSLIDVQWLIYLQDSGMLFDTCRCDLFQR